MASDWVQVTPGIPRIRTLQVTTGWQQLPAVPHCISVFLKPRSNNTAAIYVAQVANSGDLDRLELAASDPGIGMDIGNPNLLYVSAASGTQKLELICILGVR